MRARVEISSALLFGVGGIAAGKLLDEAILVPLIASAMVAWIVLGGYLGGLRTIFIGLAVLTATFASGINAWIPAFCSIAIAVLAVVSWNKKDSKSLKHS